MVKQADRDGVVVVTDAKGERPSVEMRFSTDDAEGTVRLVAGTHGPTLIVNGRELGYIDLFPPTEGGPPQLLLFHEEEDSEAFVKAVLEPAGMVAVVNAAAVEGETEHTVHSDGSDRVYTWPKDDGGEPKCDRCEMALDAQGFCTDETCPFSDHRQDCPVGWAGHPTRDPNSTIDDDCGGCTCGGRKIEGAAS